MSGRRVGACEGERIVRMVRAIERKSLKTSFRRTSRGSLCPLCAIQSKLFLYNEDRSAHHEIF